MLNSHFSKILREVLKIDDVNFVKNRKFSDCVSDFAEDGQGDFLGTLNAEVNI